MNQPTSSGARPAAGGAMRRWRRWGALLLLPVLAAALWWLLYTEAGLRWAWARAESVLSGRLVAAQVAGRLAGPLQVAGLRLDLAGARIELDSIALDWQPVWLLSGRLALQGVRVQGVRAQLKPATNSGGGAPTVLVLPLALSVAEAELRDLRLDGVGAAPVVVDVVRVAGSWRGTRLRLLPLSARGPWGHIELDGLLTTGPGLDSDMAAKWALTLSDWSLQGDGHLRGSFAEPQLAFRLSAPLTVTAKASAAWQVAPLRWQVDFELPELALDAVRREWPALRIGGQGHVSGTGADYRLSAKGEVAEPRSGRWRFDGSVASAAPGWRVERLVLAPQAGSGEVELSGHWVDHATPAQVAAQWRDFSHPLAAGWRSSGRLEARGVANDYRGQMRASAGHIGVPELEVSTDFAGSQEGIKLTELTGRWLGGDWRGAVAVNWSDGVRWQGRVLAEHVDPGQWAPGFTGSLGGVVQSAGQWRKGALELTLPQLQVRGPLEGRLFYLETAAAVSVAGNEALPQVTLHRLALESGDSRLSAAGRAGAEWGLQWRLVAGNLAELWPGLAGSLELHGRLDGHGLVPQVQVEGSADDVAWGKATVGGARLRADIDLAGALPWAVDLTVQDGRWERQRLHKAQLLASGAAAQHGIEFNAVLADGGRLALQAEGGWDGQRWQGTVRDGLVDLAAVGAWQSAGAALEWGPAGGSLERWCWQGEGEVCLGGSLRDGQGRGSVELAAMSLALLEPWLPRRGLTLEGTLDGRITAVLQDGVVTALDGRVAASNGLLRYQLANERKVESALRTLQLAVSGAGGTLAGNLQLEADHGGTVTAAVELPGWLPGQPLRDAQPLRGQLDLDTERLDWVAYLEPGLLRPKGHLEAHMQLAGTVAKPALSGRFSLEDGNVVLPAAGIRLNRLTLEGTSTDGHTLTLNGSARSGDGRLRVTGNMVVDDDEHWRAELALKGEDFELVRLVQGRALVSPDLKVTLAPGLVEVTGRLTVPQADVNLPRLPTVVEVSPDEVILDVPVSEGAQQRVRVRLDLRLVAGERVRLEGYGFTGRLAGAVTLRGDVPGLLRAQGEFNIQDGRYEAYGQNLVIDRGRLLFVDSPVDNPGLDIRAVRPLADTTQTVGVEVTGRLKQPELRLYSQPALEESETLAWLVLGRPLTSASQTEADSLYRAAFALGGTKAARDIALQFGLDEVTMEQGATGEQAAVVLGKYLTPRLYVQYAVGLWDTANALRMRYQLSSHWSLRMEQSDQSGADLLYVIER